MNRSNIFRWNWTEIGFFVFYFIILQLITDKQYVHNEGGPYSFIDSLIERSVAFVLMFIPYAFYYKIITYRLLLTKKYIAFAAALIVYLFAFDIYLRLADGITWHLTFLDVRERKWAKQSWQSSWLNFFSRQTLQLTFMNLIALTALAYFFKSRDDEKKMHTLKEQQLQLELESLRAQLNPHFFFNTLNNIYSLAQQQSPHTTEVVARLSGLMRYVLYETGNNRVPLEKEFDFITNYIELEKIRHNNSNISYEWQGNAAGKQIAPLIFVPFIENAFKHGLQQNFINAYVNIVVVLNGNELTVEIENNKPAEPEPTNPRAIGLVAARKRLDLLYAGEYILAIENKQEVFDVSLTIYLE